MSDQTPPLVERLRAITWWGKSPPPFWPEIAEAADEIERLQAEGEQFKEFTRQNLKIIEQQRLELESITAPDGDWDDPSRANGWLADE